MTGPGNFADGRPERRRIDERLIVSGTVLDSIVEARRRRIPEMQERFGHLRQADLPPSGRSLADALRTRSGASATPRPALIMECKAASPSRGTLRAAYDPAVLARAYSPWASAVSVLTEPDRFNGSFDDLAAVRAVVDVPVLCKDFIVDPVQVLAARSLGADAILLMLSVVPDDVYAELAALAAQLGLDVLTEVSTYEEMHRAASLGATVVGINNRDLRTLATDISRTEEFAPLAPPGVVLVGESGVETAADVRRLAGLVDALLVGSALSSAPEPAAVAQSLASAVPAPNGSPGSPAAGAGGRAARSLGPKDEGEGEPIAEDRSAPTASCSAAAEHGGEAREHAAHTHPRLPAYFGAYGGQFVPELLVPALDQLEDAFIEAQADPAFTAELDELLTRYLGRPTPVTELRNLPRHGNARIFLKREDLVHGGAHKGNQVMGQALLAKRMGKTRIIAETGAGQHGVATATACALFGLECIVYMGRVDTERQALNVARMRLLGAEVVAVEAGSATLKDAINEAMRDWVTNAHNTYYCFGTAAGPHPFPLMVRDLQRIVGLEARAQMLSSLGRLPDAVTACVGGGSNAIGIFHPFIEDEGVRLVGFEAAGDGVDSGRHAATFSGGTPGAFQGAFSYLLQDDDGQTIESHSISAGLDYPGVGPEHAHLLETGRAEYRPVTDTEAMDALSLLSRTEGIIPAIESAHAVAGALTLGRELGDGAAVLVNLSGRGDKDVDTAARWFGLFEKPDAAS